MPISGNTIQFVRCRFISETSGLECEETFPVLEGDVRVLCDLHKNVIGVNEAIERNAAKSEFIANKNEHAAFCAHMTLEELDVHIADLEQKIEKLKGHYFAARGTRQNKLADLSMEETSERLKKSKPRIERPREIIKPKKVSVKSDPVKHLMQQGMSEAQARSILGLRDIFGRTGDK